MLYDLKLNDRVVMVTDLPTIKYHSVATIVKIHQEPDGVSYILQQGNAIETATERDFVPLKHAYIRLLK